MLILVPWKPVVFVWLLLSAMCLFWAGASLLIDGRPSAMRMDHARHATHLVHHYRHMHGAA